MKENFKTTVPAPVGICAECLKNKSNTLTNKFGPILVSYCDHHKTGGFIYVKGRAPAWTLYTPIERETFFRTIKETSKELLSIFSNKQQQIKKH